MNKPFLEAWIDVETSGDDGGKHALLELSMSIYKNTPGSSPTCLKELNLTFKPYPGDKLNKKALKATGHTIESMMELDDPVESFSKFKGTLDKYVNPFNPFDKMIFYAFNAQFDFRFLHDWCPRRPRFNFLGSYFWWPPVDVASIVMDRIPESRHELKSFKLSNVAEYLDIKLEPERLHQANYDIELTRKVYDTVKNITP